MSPHDGPAPRDTTSSGDDGDDPAIADLAAAAIDAEDGRALDALARALDVQDPLPAGLVERATFAVALQELEVEVAILQREGLSSGREPAGVRSGTDHTFTMTFTATALSLTVAVVDTGRERHRVDGWVTTDQEVITVTLRLGDADQRVAEVRDGRFAFTDVPSGMVQVVVAAPGAEAATVVTPVFEL